MLCILPARAALATRRGEAVICDTWRMSARTGSAKKKPTPEEELAALLLSPEEAWAEFDSEARRWLGISGEDFLRKWDAHEMDVDGPQHDSIIHLSFLIPFARKISG